MWTAAGGRRGNPGFPPAPPPKPPTPHPFLCGTVSGVGPQRTPGRRQHRRSRPGRGSFNRALSWAGIGRRPCGLPRQRRHAASAARCAFRPSRGRARWSLRSAGDAKHGTEYRAARLFASPAALHSKDAARTRLRSSVPIPPAQARPSPDARGSFHDHDAQPSPAPLAQIAAGPWRTMAPATNCAPQAAASSSGSVPRFRPRSLRSSPPPRRGGAGRSACRACPRVADSSRVSPVTLTAFLGAPLSFP